MNLEWTYAALADRNSIYDYIEADNPTAAIRLDQKFSQAAERLAQFPHMGHAGPGTRNF